MLAFHAPPSCGDHARDQVWKQRRQDQRPPARPTLELQQLGRIGQVFRDGRRARDDVEQHVPLRAHQHQEHCRQVQPAASRMNAKRITGKSAVAGIEATICTMG